MALNMKSKNVGTPQGGPTDYSAHLTAVPAGSAVTQVTKKAKGVVKSEDQTEEPHGGMMLIKPDRLALARAQTEIGATRAHAAHAVLAQLPPEAAE